MPVINGGGGGGIQTATVSLTNAQVRALPTTSVQLVAAPGAGKVILGPANGAGYAFIRCDTTAAFYTNVAANAQFDLFLGIGDVGVAYPFANNILTFGDNTLWVAQTVDTVTGTGGSFVDSVAAIANQPLMLDVNNHGSGNITGGDAANTFKITVGFWVAQVV